MMRFIWDEKYALNIKSIDKQHQRFFEIINEIYFLTGNDRQEKKKIVKILGELKDYADFHLKYEEKFFKELKYPEKSGHVAAHDEFRKKIKKFFKLSDVSGAEIAKIANEMADFVKEWLSAHILDMDHKYVSFFIINDVR